MSFRSVFKGHRRRTGPPARGGGALPRAPPLRRPMRFRGGIFAIVCARVKEKRQLFPGPALASRPSFALPQSGGGGPRLGGPPSHYPRPGAGILTRFPFACGDPLRGRACATGFPHRLGPTNPRRSALPAEPFPTSAYKGRACIFATTTKICTGARSRAPLTGNAFATRATSFYSPPLRAWGGGRVWAARLSAIHFQG